ncbi:hypothetical protein [Agromyces bauzanensis]
MGKGQVWDREAWGESYYNRGLYDRAAAELIAATNSKLTTHSKTPPIFLRHKNHWSGWSITFRLPRPSDGDSPAPLYWDLKNAAGPVSLKQVEGNRLGHTVLVDGKRSGHVIMIVPPHGLIGVPCACGLKYFDQMNTATLIRLAAKSLGDTPKTIDSRIYVRPPLE